MLNKKILLCSLVLILTTFSSVAFATTPAPVPIPVGPPVLPPLPTAPYASIVSYVQEPNANPWINTLETLDIINMTPWDISIGDRPGSNVPMLVGMTELPIVPFWMSGINGLNWTPGQPVVTSGKTMGFAFHSIQVKLNDTNNVWKLSNLIPNTGSALNTYYTSIPITFGSRVGTSATDAVGLNFIVTSSAGLQANATKKGGGTPIPLLMSGPGVRYYTTQPQPPINNNVWSSNLFNYDNGQYGGNAPSRATQLLTIQARPATNGLKAGNTWYPITSNLVPIAPQSELAPGKPSNFPQVCTLAGLVCPNYSSTAAFPVASYDLVVLLQSGNYADMALIFLAVPSANDPFYKSGQ